MKRLPTKRSMRTGSGSSYLSPLQNKNDCSRFSLAKKSVAVPSDVPKAFGLSTKPTGRSGLPSLGRSLEFLSGLNGSAERFRTSGGIAESSESIHIKPLRPAQTHRSQSHGFAPIALSALQERPDAAHDRDCGDSGRIATFGAGNEDRVADLKVGQAKGRQLIKHLLQISARFGWARRGRRRVVSFRFTRRQGSQ